MKQIALKYGKETCSLSVSEQTRILGIKDPVVDIDKDIFCNQLTQLIDRSQITGKIAVVIADKTRLCGYQQILPWVIETLINKGAQTENITFFIAYGTHPRQTDDECRAAYGSVYDKHRFVHHDCSDQAALKQLGVTSNGTKVTINREVAEAGLILTIGAVSHHYFAGYGGARKLLFPGVAQKECIYNNHQLYLDRKQQKLSFGCWPGNLEGNPLAEDLKEVHNILPQYLSIHAILNSKGQPAQYHFGRTYNDFLDVCTKLDNYYQLGIEEQFDLVVGSAGGYPKDINMIQTHKSIHNAANLVKDNGTLIMFAECVDGVASTTFLPYFEMGGWKNSFAALVDNYAGNGGTALAMMEKTRRIRILMVTQLPDDVCEKIGVRRITQEESQEILDNHSGTLAVIPNGSLLISKRM